MTTPNGDLDSQALRDITRGFMGEFDLEEETPDFDATGVHQNVEYHQFTPISVCNSTDELAASVPGHVSQTRVHSSASALVLSPDQGRSSGRSKCLRSIYQDERNQNLTERGCSDPCLMVKSYPVSINQIRQRMANVSPGRSGPSYDDEKTQEVSPRVYEEYLSHRRLQSNEGIKGRILDYLPPDRSNSQSPDGTGSFDLAKNRDEDNEGDKMNETGLIDSSPESFSIQHISELNRFPRTPATYGKKRKLDITVQPTSTPRLPRNPFVHYNGNDGGLMELSQVFNATQRPTSPLQGSISDPVTDRPSPDLFNISRDGYQATFSSPLQVRRGTGASAEPQSEYVTMEESQEERARRLREEATSKTIRGSKRQFDDDDFDSEQESIQRRRKEYLKRIDEDAIRQFTSLQPMHPKLTATRQADSAGSKRRHQRAFSAGDVSKSQAIEIRDDSPLGEEETEADDSDEEAQTQIAPIGEAANGTRSVRNIIATPNYHFRVSGGNSNQHQTPNMPGSQCIAVADSQRSQRSLLDTPFSKTFGAIDRIPALPSSVESRELIVQSQRVISQKHFEESSLIPPPPPISSGTNLSSSPVISRRRGPNHQYGSPSTPKLLPRAFQTSQQDAVERSSPPPLLNSKSTKTSESVSSLDADKENMDPHVENYYGFRPQMGPEGMDVDQEQQPEDPHLKALDHSYQTLENQERQAVAVTDPNEQLTNANRQMIPPETEHPTSKPNLDRKKFLSPNKSLSSSQRRHSAPASPEKRTLRTLTEIAAASPQSDIFGEVDTDFRIMSTQDLAYQEAIQSSASSPVAPSRKRRRANDDRALQQSEAQANQRPRLLTPEQAEDVENLGLISVKSFSRASPMPVDRVTKGRLKRPSKTPFADKLVSTPGNDLKITSKTVSTSPVHTFTNSKDVMLHPKRVFAKFKGGKNAYYPATCLSSNQSDQVTFKVRFDDGMVDSLPSQFVRRLDLRPGDVVKVDLDHMRTKNYVVLGLMNRLSNRSHPQTHLGNEGESDGPIKYPMTDIWGYQTVLLAQKQRDSIPGDHLLESTDTVEVPMTSIYIVQLNWVKFDDRPYSHPNKDSEKAVVSCLGENITSGFASNITTPSVRGKKITSSTEAHSLASFSLSRQVQDTKGLFQGMVFAVSYTESSGGIPTNPQKAFVTHEIMKRGGFIVNEGFDELFDTDMSNLNLTESVTNRGFGCLIADKHSRKAKYMQALALGLPCLSGYWIEHCTQKESLLDWRPYLLAAGDCSILGGCSISRVLPLYPASTAKLEMALDARPKLFADLSVLLVTSKGKSGKERKAYPFLAKALGAVRIERVATLELAHSKLQEATTDSWDLVHVPGNITDAEHELFKDGNKKGRKRKFTGGESTKKRARIVNDEFVIQSLILGKLVEDF